MFVPGGSKPATCLLERVRLPLFRLYVGLVPRAHVPCRNKDFQEVTLEHEGQVLLRFAAAYGFRNIQNLVQKLKRGRCPYHYVEVMACPAGARCCRLGGLGQGWPQSPVTHLSCSLHRLPKRWGPAAGA